MQPVLARHDELLRAAIEHHGGTVFSTTGDGLAAAFTSVVAAAGAALDAQASIGSEPWPVANAISVRMGIHLGEAEVRGGDWFGSALNRAARVMSVAHGGQIVVTDAVADAVRKLLPVDSCLTDLGVHRLRDVSTAQRLWQLSRPDLRGSFPPLRSLGEVAVGLPAYLTSFVGREDELETLVDLVKTTRLLTLAGPAGVGKTRLAAAVAGQSQEACPDGAWFVELASLAEPSRLDDLVATALGLAATSGSRREVVLDAIGQRHLMVIVDNAEHLLDAVEDLVSAMLRRCPFVHVVVTSREPLGVPGEQVWPVRSLEIDAASALFAARAHAANPDAVLDEPAVLRICTRLDGIPMAIELAAARVRSLSVGEIATRIDERFDLLGVDRRGAIGRHRTMRAAIEWSYRLLDDDARTLFDRVSIFAGRFDLAAAEAVAGFPPLDPSRVVDVLDDLTAKSMLLAEVRLSTTRYRLLESLREFAAEHLAGDVAQTAERHAVYYTAFAEAQGGFTLADDESRLERVIDELDNLRAAVTYAVANDEEDLALRLTTSLQVLWHLYDFPEVGTWVAAAADMPRANDHPLGATAHGQAALAASYRLDVDAWERHLIHAAGTYWEPYARAYLPTSNEQGLSEIRRAVALADDDHRAQVVLDSYNVLISAVCGVTAEDSWERLRDFAEEQPYYGLLLVRRAEAHEALHRGDRVAALAAYDEVLAISSLATRRSLVWVWACIPRLLLLFEVDRLAAVADAYSYLIEARNVGSRRWVQATLARIAVMLARLGRPEASAMLRSFTREPKGGASMADGDPAELLSYDTLSPEQLNALGVRGARLAFDAAIQLALDELEDVRTGATDLATSKDDGSG